MNKHITPLILATFALSMCSCATMFNSKKTSLNIITSEPSNLIINRDTIKYLSTSRSITVDRDENPINITAYNDSSIKTVSVESQNSFAYWLNLYPNLHLWTGFSIDTKTKKKYTYPKTIYIDIAARDSSYLTYEPLENPFDEYSNIFKLTPFKLVGIMNPSIEFSYERRTGRGFSTQLTASYLLPTSMMYIGNDIKPDIKGFSVSIEEKFYFKRSAPLGPYASFEFSYLKNQYTDLWHFGVENIYGDTAYNFTNYPDTFGIRKQTFSFNLKLGYQLIIKRFAIDLYAGIGLRYKDVAHFDRINPKDGMEIPRHPNVFYITNREGKYWTISIPLNVRMGWTF